MKVAYLLDEFPSISETFHLQRIAELIDRGIEVDIFAHHLNYKGLEIHKALINKYQLMDKTQWSNMPSDKFKRIIDFIIIIFSKNGRIIIKKIFKTMDYSPYLIFNIRRFYRHLTFYKLLKRYDIIHAGFGTVGLECLPLDLINNNADVKLVVSFCGSDVNVCLKKYGNSFYNKLFNDAKLLLPITDSLKIKLLNAGAPTEKVVNHKNGLLLSRHNYVERKNIEGIPAILGVGRLISVKGFKYGIKAIELLIRSGHEVNYTIIGYGPQKNNLRNQISNLKLENNIKIISNITVEELKNYYMNADIFLFTSNSTNDGMQEGMPTVLLESLAYGLPVVSTKIGGVKELINNNVNGILVNQRDDRSMANELTKLINNRTLRQKLSENGRKIIEMEYDIRKLNDGLIKLYNNC